MPKPKKGPRLGGSASHQKKILANLAAELITNHKIKTTDAKARLLRPFVEKVITKARKGSLADRRNALAVVPNKTAIHYLFDQLAPQFMDRDGGYTRIIKLENRKGDNAPMSLIELVLEPTVSTEATAVTAAAASKDAEDAAPEAVEESVEAEETAPAPVEETSSEEQ